MSSGTRPDGENAWCLECSSEVEKTEDDECTECGELTVPMFDWAAVRKLRSQVERLTAELETWERRAPAEAGHLRDARERCERLTAERDGARASRDHWRDEVANEALATVARLTEALRDQHFYGGRCLISGECKVCAEFFSEPQEAPPTERQSDDGS